ncbi:SUMF1/EgtB/PvdO family nonheme iron enzyme [Mucilaginibacter sp.]|uniref:SUMF1/EgtB/PvdO family nonheme iron enzyme n=1 Tax=Mucilaginibacter sp. TaxID=1882438 RepID=UPI002631AB9A|nr:SUMF1/EgtB/PvdO family nonheme iron enzyme [Mucilaginibacter sp.]MDB4922916.1 hypothetical protein [Mucilaginibacter sp.]
MKKTYNIFISYHLADARTHYSKLIASLDREGFSCWTDFDDVDQNNNFDRELSAAIKECEFFLVCITANMANGEYMAEEIEYAKQNGKTIIPLIFENVIVPLRLAALRRVDFINYRKGLSDLVAILQGSFNKKKKTPEEKELEYLASIGDMFHAIDPTYAQLTFKGNYSDKVKNAFATTLFQKTELNQFLHKNSDSASITITKIKELIAFILIHKRVAILGESGAGKTFTLQKIAYELAKMRLSDNTVPLPIYISLGTYVGEHFSIFLNENFGELNINKLGSANVILLLDGLNEIPTENLEAFYSGISKSEYACVLSSRKIDYISPEKHFYEITIKSLDVRQIRSFIHNYLKEEAAEEFFWKMCGIEVSNLWDWYRATYTDVNIDNFWYDKPYENVRSNEVNKLKINKLRKSYQTSGIMPHLLEFAKSPYLLFVMCCILVNEGDLPQNRASLLKIFVEILLSSGRKRSKRKFADVPDDTQRIAMSKLAFLIQSEKKGTFFEEDWAIDVLNKSVSGFSSDSLIYHAVCANLIEKHQHLKFSHQLLQEYFAAFELIDDIENGARVEEYFSDAEWWKPTGWEESLLFSVSIVKDATNIFKWLIPANPDLAFLCSREHGIKFDNELLSKIYEPALGERVSPYAKKEWGELLAKNGDSRDGVGYSAVPDIAWIKVPAGQLDIGNDVHCGEMGFAWEGMKVKIDTPFLMAKFPVTNGQFEKFIEMGYNEERFWTKEGFEWKADQQNPLNWKPEAFEDYNQPVTDVTWYEAYAFTKWLNELIGDEVKKAYDFPDCEIRLATEMEWEYAARYPDGRCFPWGNEYIAGYANIDETAEEAKVGPYFLGKKTAVGMYEQGNSALGISDMCGNVWEWCQTIWQQKLSESCNNSPEGDGFRSLRGGSWLNSCIFSRNATRDHFDAELFVYDVGFRIVFAPKIM